MCESACNNYVWTSGGAMAHSFVYVWERETVHVHVSIDVIIRLLYPLTIKYILLLLSYYLSNWYAHLFCLF